MKKMFILLVVLLTSFLKLDAQKIEWAESIGGNGAEYARKTLVDKQNNVYVVGKFNSDTLYLNNGKYLLNSTFEYGFKDSDDENKYYSDGFIAKYDSNGHCIWAHRIGGKEEDFLSDLGIDSFGNLYIIGGSLSDTIKMNTKTIIINDSGAVCSIYKFDSGGNLLWVENIWSKRMFSLTSIVIDYEGNIIIGGLFYAGILYFNNNISLNNINIPLANNNRGDSFIAKYNKEGICMWADVLKGYGNKKPYWYGTEAINDLSTNSIGNIFIAGNFSAEIDSLVFNNGISISKSGYGDGYIAMYNPLGICEWATKIGGKQQDYVKGISIYKEQYLYVIGYSDSDTLQFNNGISLNKSKNILFNSYSFISIFDMDGNCLAVERISGSRNYILNIDIDINGNIYVIGNSEANIDFNNGISLKKNSKSINFSFIAQFNSDLICNWAEQVYGDKTVNIEGLAISENNQIYVCGCHNSDEIFFSNGYMISNTVMDSQLSSNEDGFLASFKQLPSSITDNYHSISFIIYPNPTTDFMTIQLSNKGLKPYAAEGNKVQIFDVLGIEIMSESIHPMTGSHRMNVEKLPAGVYFIRIGNRVEKFVKM